MVWVLLETFYFGKPTVFGAIQDMITGLACITPAAGVGSDLDGFDLRKRSLVHNDDLHNKVPLLNQINDPMAVFHNTHAVAGALGGILTGLFAVPKLCRLFYMAYGLQNGATGAGLRQMGIEVGAVVFVIIFNFVTTSLICLLVGALVPLRLHTDAVQMGDKAVHGEDGFALNAEPAKFENINHNKIYDTRLFLR